MGHGRTAVSESLLPGLLMSYSRGYPVTLYTMSPCMKYMMLVTAVTLCVHSSAAPSLANAVQHHIKDNLGALKRGLKKRKEPAQHTQRCAITLAHIHNH
jgi:hypothetical protein